jgi:hypothetical protein
MLIPNRCVLVSEAANLERVEACQKREQLTNWERIYLYSLDARLNSAGKLTVDQVKVLERIWRKI